MTVRYFAVTGLGGVEHNSQTLEIMNSLEDITFSQFNRKSIVTFALAEGYKKLANGHKPDYLSNKQWQMIKNIEERAREVDYTYLAAFHWLQNIKFTGVSKGWLMRHIIINSPLLISNK